MSHLADAPACLCTLYSSRSQRGGTLIAEEVVDLDDHRKRIGFINYYRPEECGRCGNERLHGHGLRHRELKLGADWSITEQIRRFICAQCGAIWQVLPAVIARHLHRTWDTVQAVGLKAGALAGSLKGSAPTVPARTTKRWLARLALTAWMLAQALGATGVSEGAEAGSSARAVYVDALAASGAVAADHKLAQVAEWIHRVAPGVRLM